MSQFVRQQPEPFARIRIVPACPKNSVLAGRKCLGSHGTGRPGGAVSVVQSDGVHVEAESRLAESSDSFARIHGLVGNPGGSPFVHVVSHADAARRRAG
ncbi:MAG TPA: hypothetical protein VKF41_03690 [Bryobacteraceae bacterium]|nr:hypothetical protein [Bryobacteraceae bacterium]